MLRSDRTVLMVFVFGWLIIGSIGILLFATQYYGWRFFAPTITSLPPHTQNIVVFPNTLPTGYRYLSWGSGSASVEHQSDGQRIDFYSCDIKPSEDIEKLTSIGVLNDLLKNRFLHLSVRSKGEKQIAGRTAPFVVGPHEITKELTMDSFLAVLPDRTRRRFIVISGRQPVGDYDLSVTSTLLNSIKQPQ